MVEQILGVQDIFSATSFASLANLGEGESNKGEGVAHEACQREGVVCEALEGVYFLS